jgi:hypothetical protein
MSDIKYYVLDHHSFWGWPKSNSTLEDSEVVFTWNDFSLKDDVFKWKKQGKKVVCFEHGWNAFFDYQINNQEMLADGYLSLGNSSAKSLLDYGLDKKKLLITGNPHFDNLHIAEEKNNIVPQVLYTALHWTRDMREYNNAKLQEIVTKLSPYADISVKTIEKSKVEIPENVKEWRSEINENSSLFKDIQEHLGDYDIILTPKESTFDFIALKLGKKVFRIGKEEEYHKEGEPKTRNILPYSPISTDIFFKNHSIMVNLDDEVVKSLKLKEILNWTKTL